MTSCPHRRYRTLSLIVFNLCQLLLTAFLVVPNAAHAGERRLLTISSRLDGSDQPAYLIVPQQDTPSEVPLVVSLHTWSGDCEQRDESLEAAVAERGWFYLFPNFRGRNDRPQACGSPLAQQDILDAVAHVVEQYPIDRRRVYLAGTSGGGHMTMLMAGLHPDVWAAASAWVGISDLAAWQNLHAADNYGRMTRACCGGTPGESNQIDEQYRKRSPLTHLGAAVGLPLDLAAGVHDGHQGSVPIRHTLDAFNTIARAQRADVISEEEIEQLSRPNGRLEEPHPTDRVEDPTFGRAIYLRRMAGPARVTIFEGGHEGIASATVAWFDRHARIQPIANHALRGEDNSDE